MSARKSFTCFSTLAVAIAVSSLAAAHGMRSAGPPLSEGQLQSLSSEGPTWHAGDRTVYDPNAARETYARRPPSSTIALQTPRSNVRAAPSAGLPLSGSQAIPGYTGPNSTKGQ